MSHSSAPVVRPSDLAGVANALREAGAADCTVAIRGAGTKAAWGGELSTVDLVLDTTGLSGVVSHEPGDRVVTVRAGTPLRDLQEVLAASGQRLAVSSGYDDATVGGVLATGEAGPLRLRYGSGRDLLIGVEFVRADGVVAHSGGRVVKNVAGYDLGRLLCGSYGTVGVITQAAFRLHPLPAESAWVVARVRKGTVLTPGVQHGALADIVAAAEAPAVAASAIECNLSGDGGEIAVLVEGSPAGVAARAELLRALLEPWARDADVTEKPPAWWGRYPFGDGEVGLKVAAPVGAVPAVVGVLRGHLGDAATIRGSVGAGVLSAGAPATARAWDLLAAVDEVRALLAGTGGSCVAVTMPPSLRAGLDQWGPVAGLDLMRRLKQQFDPTGRFAPGRFVGGL